MVCLGWKKYLEMQSVFWEKKLWILRSNRRKKVVGVRRGNTHKSKLFWTRNPWLNIKMGQMGVFDGVMKNNREGRWARILSHQKPQTVLTEGIESFFSNSVKKSNSGWILHQIDSKKWIISICLSSNSYIKVLIDCTVLPVIITLTFHQSCSRT